MNNRMELHEKLVNILGSRHVYCQPPETIKMVYPCILYRLNNIDTLHADDKPYINTNNYLITVIDKDPDSTIPYELLKIPMCRFDRTYTADNLNHWVFNLYF